MLFTVLGRVVATLIILFVAFQIVAGVTTAMSDDPVATAARYLGSSTSGQAINSKIEMIFHVLVLGTITEISRNLTAAKNEAGTDSERFRLNLLALHSS